jgi:hypothetical protein
MELKMYDVSHVRQHSSLTPLAGLSRTHKSRRQLGRKNCDRPFWWTIPWSEGQREYFIYLWHVCSKLQVKGAQELGAVGVLIYVDPRDDGYVTVENGYAPYPEGPARNPTSMERGSVMFISSFPGDPTTPGYPAYKDAKREVPTNIPTIPSLPISFHAAERLLEEIDGIYSGFSEDGSKRKLSGKASTARVKIVNHGARDSVYIYYCVTDILMQ